MLKHRLMGTCPPFHRIIPAKAGIHLFRPHASSSSWPGMTGKAGCSWRPLTGLPATEPVERSSQGLLRGNRSTGAISSPFEAPKGARVINGHALSASSPRPSGERDRVRGRHESDRQSMPTHPARPGLSCHFSSLSRCRTGKVQPTFPGNAPRVCDPARRRPRAVVRE